MCQKQKPDAKPANRFSVARCFPNHPYLHQSTVCRYWLVKYKNVTSQTKNYSKSFQVVTIKHIRGYKDS